MIKKFYYFICILSFSVVNAQNISLDELAEKYISALGGIEKLEKLQVARFEQTLYMNNQEIPQVLIIRPEKAFYQESDLPVGKIITVVVKGEKGWVKNPYVKPDLKDLSDKQSNMLLYQTDLFGPLYDYYRNKKSYKNQIELLPDTTEVDFHKCYIVSVKYPNGWVDKLYIDQKKFYLIKIENTMGSVTFSGYKKREGIAFAFGKTFSNNGFSNSAAIFSIKINPKVDDKIFEKPVK